MLYLTHLLKRFTVLTSKHPNHISVPCHKLGELSVQSADIICKIDIIVPIAFTFAWSFTKRLSNQVCVKELIPILHRHWQTMMYFKNIYYFNSEILFSNFNSQELYNENFPLFIIDNIYTITKRLRLSMQVHKASKT